jgi:type I site-specific restriction endonuclease
MAVTANQTPEERARDTIDRCLCDAGWIVQSRVDQGGLGKPRHIFGAQIPVILKEMNEVLAA